MTVYLVGAGPGDPGLLTVRGAELLARADAVVYDRLSARELLRTVPERAELHDVGKGAGRSSIDQAAINRLLVELGQRFGPAGVVVRLKGGDPFVFARGAEEVEALLDSGVPTEVVPGVSSAIAAPAYAGIPLTRRFSSTSFTVVTGHEDPTKGDGQVDWEAIAAVGGTIVVLMGVARIGEITARLMAGGLAPDTPAAAVRWGTRPEQFVVRSTLSELASQRLAAPSVIVIGDVAAAELDWFAARPLSAVSVVVTRAPEQSSRLSDALAARGAAVLSVPTVSQQDPSDASAALGAAVHELAAGQRGPRWLVVSSPTAAVRFHDALQSATVAAGSTPRTRLLADGVALVAMGPGTAEALRRRGLAVDLVPDRYVAEGVLDALGAPAPSAIGSAREVWILGAEQSRPVLADGLVAAGWSVTSVATHRTVAVEVPDAALDGVAAADVVAFASSSAVQSFVASVPSPRWPGVAAAIGPITAATAREAGFAVVLNAAEHTIDGLVEVIEQWAIDRAR